MPRYSKSEIAAIEADQAYWNELSSVLGWKLRAFTDRGSASFITAGLDTGRWVSIEILGSQRDDIMRAITRTDNR